MLGLGHCFFAFAGGPRVRHSSPNPRSVQLRSLAPSEFELFKGRVIDTLTHKYTNLYTEKPDFSIFTPNVVLSDSSGKRIQGLQRRLVAQFRDDGMPSDVVEGSHVTYS